MLATIATVPPQPPASDNEIAMRNTRWHSYAPSLDASPTATRAPSPPSILPPLHSLPSLLPSMNVPGFMSFFRDQPARSMDVRLPPLGPPPLSQSSPLEDRKRMHSSGLLCLVEAAVRSPSPVTDASSDTAPTGSDPKRQKKMERPDIGTFIHVYNPLEATRRGRPRGRPFAKAATHSRKGKVMNGMPNMGNNVTAAVVAPAFRCEGSGMERAESETAA